MTEPLPRPDLSEPAVAAYWEALDAGELRFQRCLACGSPWLPPQAACPVCLAEDYAWERASGRGHVVASTVFHRAYHPAFADRIPYSVSLVELAEGPRLLTNVTGPGARRPGTEVALAIVRSDGIALARFVLAARAG
jgi:uncharacterized OB-fold protein